MSSFSFLLNPPPLTSPHQSCEPAFYVSPHFNSAVSSYDYKSTPETSSFSIWFKPGKITFSFDFHLPRCKRVNDVATAEHTVKFSEQSQWCPALGEGRSMRKGWYQSSVSDCTSPRPQFWHTDHSLVLEFQVFSFYEITFPCGVYSCTDHFLSVLLS